MKQNHIINRVVFFILLFGFLSVNIAYSQANFKFTIKNQSVHLGATIDTLFFDVFVQKTGNGNIYFANCDVRINFNSTFFTSPTMGIISGTTSLTGYSASAGIPATGVLSLSLVPPTPNDNTDFGPVIPAISTVDSVTRLATVRVRGVTNRTGTAGLTFRMGQVSNNCIITNFDTTDAGATTTNTISANGTYTNPSDLALPVELASFTAITKGRNVELAWKTATETNNAGFEIQRKQEGTEWSKVGYVEGNGTSAKENSYSYKDAVKAATTYSYRLKQIDRDGKFEYSSVVEAVTTLSAEDYKLSSNYPNPFNPSTKFNFAVKNADQVSVKIFNGIGQEVASLFNEVAVPDQIYEMNFNGTNLASGTYFYVLRTSGRYEVKKMLLMK